MPAAFRGLMRELVLCDATERPSAYTAWRILACAAFVTADVSTESDCQSWLWAARQAAAKQRDVFPDTEVRCLRALVS